MRVGAVVLVAACGGLPAPVDEALTTSTPLRSYADPAGVKLGTAMSPDAYGSDQLFEDIVAHQFNMVVAEHFMGMDVLQLNRGTWDFARTDAFLAFAADHQLVVRGPTLIYGKDNPKWLDDGTWTPATLEVEIRNHVHAVLDHVRGKIFAYDIVNETLGDALGTYTDNIYTHVFAADPVEYIHAAFDEAVKTDPDVQLYINDFGFERGGDKFENMKDLVTELRSRGDRVDGIGYQMHVKADVATDEATFISDVRGTMQAFAAMGLDVTITELDVRIHGDASASDLANQAQVFGDVFDLCRSMSNCKAFMMWGFTDRYSWIPKSFSGFGEALILDDRFAFKPAYDTLLDRVRAASN